MSIRTVGLCCLSIYFMSVSSFSIGATTLYVSPTGNDDWSGRYSKSKSNGEDGPLATLRGARDKIRRLRIKDNLKTSVQVVVQDGIYFLNEPLIFTPQDSGSSSVSIHYKAAPGANPIFAGGRRINGFKEIAKGLWKTHLPDVRGKKWHFEQLWVNGQRASRARTPNNGYFKTVRAVTEGIDTGGEKIENLSRRAFIGNPSNIKQLSKLTSGELQDVTTVIPHSWDISRLPIEKINPETGLIITLGLSGWPFMKWGSSQRYYLENFKSALDKPGEWFLERNGDLYYKPMPGESLTSLKVFAPTINEFIRIEGEPQNKVEHITFEGLSFHYSQYILPSQGQNENQASSYIPAAIMMNHARNINFKKNVISHTGTYGIWIKKGCTNNNLVGNFFYDLGAGGVRVGEEVIRDQVYDLTHNNFIDNNTIRKGGRIFTGAVGVWVGQSGDNRITHNEISDFYYTGISVGWTWGYGNSLAKRNVIRSNHIFNIGQGVLSDMGGIYTLGISDGTKIQNNLIHGISSFNDYGRGGWGIYNDEGSSNILVENNLVYNTSTGGYHLHYGRNNIIKNNIFAFSKDGQLQRSRVENHISLVFYNNIVYWKDGALFNGFWDDNGVKTYRNLYWNTGKIIDVFPGNKNLFSWQYLGKENGSVLVDPLFENPDHGNFNLRTNILVKRINFQPFNYKKTGPINLFKRKI